MHADLIFTGGPIWTSDPARTIASSLAVSGGTITAVGHDEVLALRGPGTEVVDLSGRMLTPGFIDSHVHAIWGGLDLLRCNLAELSTADEYLAAIVAYGDAHPDDEWILGGGWAMSSFPGGTPSAEDLDRVTGSRPAFLTNRDGHGAWVNSAALRLAGIDAATPDPADGRIERLPDGSPQGTLHEGAMALVNRLLPTETPERMREALLVAQAYLHERGITGWQDAILGDYGDAPNPGPVYLALAQEGTLTARVRGALWWARDRGLEQIPDLEARRAEWQHGRFAATSVKLMQDGVPENFTASMLEPYYDQCGHPSDNSGIDFIDPEVLRQAVTALDRLGFQSHFHAIGDKAVRDCLDAVETMRRENGWSDTRPHLSHLQVVHPDDLDRFRALGVTANMQMLWASLEPQMIELVLPFLSAERASWQYPFGDLERSGATLACGSDWSVSTPNPWEAIHVAVNRRSPESDEAGAEAFLPSQRLSLATALTAYTAGSAYVNHWPDCGTLRVGAEADLVLVDRNPFAAPPNEIGETQTLATWVAGERVFTAQP